MPTNDPRPTKAAKREAARADAARMREEAKRREQRNRRLAIGGLALAVVALVVVVVLVIVNRPGPVAYTGEAVTLDEVTMPATAGDNGGITVAADGVAGGTATGDEVVVTVYADFMCPWCGVFERVNGPALSELRESGEVVVEYHMVSILDRLSSGTAYSTRAANAAAVVADAAPEAFVAFVEGLFAQQPEESSSGLSDGEIADIAREAGVPDAVVDRLTERAPGGQWRAFAPYVSALTGQASTDLVALGMTQLSTPTILLDGQILDSSVYDWRTEGALAQAVAGTRAARG